MERIGQSVAASDLDAFVFAHFERLIRLAALVGGDTSEADDVVQAALERAWRSRERLRNAEALGAWLDRIVVREAIRAAGRRRRWWSRRRDLVAADELAAAGADQPERFAALRTAFQTLPPDQRAVVALHLYAGYSVPETASRLQAPVETVRSRLRLARGRLRRAREEELP